eukprot:6182265-Pleurochrysis_carterae.AAC.1
MTKCSTCRPLSWACAGLSSSMCGRAGGLTPVRHTPLNMSAAPPDCPGPLQVAARRRESNARGLGHSAG